MSSRWLQSGIVAVLFLITGNLGHLVAIPPGLATPIWLPSGVTVAAFIVWGARVWPGVMLGAVVISWQRVGQSDSIAAVAFSSVVVLAIAASVLIEPLIASRVYIGTRRHRPFLSHPRNVATLLLVAAPLSCLVTSVVAALVMASLGLTSWANCTETCSTWLIGDLAGIYMLTPAILTWAEGGSDEGPMRDRSLAILSVAILLAVCVVAFLDVPPIGSLPSLDYLPLPLMIFVAYRFDDRLASLVGPGVAVFALVAAINGYGPFRHGASNRSLLGLQLFMMVGVSTALFARALANQRDSADREAQRLSADLAHLSRVTLMGELAAGMAHEYHQPLTAITNYASICMIKLRPHGEAFRDVRESLEHISAEALRAARIVDRLKGFLRKRESERKPCDANAIVADAVHLTRVAHSFPNTSLEYAPTPDLPMVVVDGVQITQILVNLLVNACESIAGSEHGRGDVSITVSAEDRYKLVFSVEDNGPGMDDASLRACFDQFYSTKEKGLGIGLGISKTLAQAHGGDLYHERPAAGGARFCLVLPVST